MAIEGFDYKGFAQNLAQQALELIPPEFNENQRNYVANTLLNFSTVAGEALYNDNQLNFNVDQAVMITQIIAEWSFHKSVDLIKSGIPQQYWDPIMQKIAFTIFEIAKNAFHQGLPQDQCLQLIEHHVKKTYLDCISELKEKNLIDEGLMEQAASQSNIDAMVQQQAEISQEQQVQNTQVQQSVPQKPVSQNVNNSSNVTVPDMNLDGLKIGSEPKILKLATLAMLFQKLQQDRVQTYLNKFNPDDSGIIIKFMGMPNLDTKVDAGAAIKCLHEIESQLPKNTERTINKISVLEKLQNISQFMTKTKIEQTLRLERQRVKRFVFTALEGEYYNLPPYVGNVIAQHLEDSV